MQKLAFLIVSLNFLVNYLLLMGVDRLTGMTAPLYRRAMGAGLLALYSGLCVLPELKIPTGFTWRLASLTAAAVTAYGFRSPGKTGIFLLLQFALVGLTQSTGKQQLWGQCLAGAAVSLICMLTPGRDRGQSFVSVELSRLGKRERLTALVDTGNTLRDPVSGSGVLVISGSAAQKLTGLTLQQLRSPVETARQAAVSGLRLIPCRTVAGSSLLLALRFPQAVIGGKKRDVLVAFAPGELDGMYQALIGGNV